MDVFRDLGLAFAAALIGIYVLLVYETRFVRDAAGDHALDPADADRHHAGLLAAERGATARSAASPTRSSSPRRR